MLIFFNLVRIFKLNIFQIDYQIRIFLVIFGCIAAFALGAHLTAAIVGIYAPFLNLNIELLNFNLVLDDNKLYFFGSLLIGVGLLFFHKKL